MSTIKNGVPFIINSNKDKRENIEQSEMGKNAVFALDLWQHNVYTTYYAKIFNFSDFIGRPFVLFRDDERCDDAA